MSFCNKCRPQIKKFLKYIDKQLLKNIDIGLTVAAKLKQAIDSRFLVTLIDLTPTTVDDNLRKKISSVLSLILNKFGYLHIGDLINDTSLKSNKKEALLIKTASLVTMELDNRHSQNIYDSAVQLQYSLNKQ